MINRFTRIELNTEILSYAVNVNDKHSSKDGKDGKEGKDDISAMLNRGAWV